MAASIRPASSLFKPSFYSPSFRFPTSSASPARCRCQPFSQSARRNASPMAIKAAKPKTPPQMSMRTRFKEAINNNLDALPDDVGLLPDTFVRPVWKNRPSILKDFKSRMRMEWLSLKLAFTNFIGLLSYCKYFNKGLPLRLRERKRKALELHREMYNAFAAGDTSAIPKICCQGLSETFTRRITNRPPTARKLNWTLHKYVRFPFSPTISGARVVSDRAAPFPGTDGMGIRQAIIRIRSRQSITKPQPKPASGAVAENGDVRGNSQESVTQQDCTEYVVLQRFMIRGEEKDWKVWGLAEETTLEEMDSNPQWASGVSIKDKLSALTSGKM